MINVLCCNTWVLQNSTTVIFSFDRILERSTQMPEWILNPTSFTFGRSFDFWIGAAGFVITIGGFILGFRRLRKVQSATEAATNAVTQFRFKVRAYDAGKDMSEAKYALQSALRHLEHPTWNHVRSSLDDAGYAMKRVKTVLEGVNARKASRLKVANADLDKMNAAIDQGLTDPVALPSVADVRQAIRTYRDLIDEVQQLLDGAL